MARATATINNLRIKDQMLAFSMESSGDTAVELLLYMAVYDAAGTMRQQSDLGSMVPGQPWTAELDLPVSDLEDGDYTAWVSVYLYDEAETNPDDTPLVQQGVSFLVGRGRIYASNERPDAPTSADPPRVSKPRLDGTWVVFDMTNSEHFDVEVHHELSVYNQAGDEVHKANGQELLRASATQQGHHLLPEELADGRYMLMVVVNREGSDMPSVTSSWMEVAGTVITEVPSEY
ncbi:MAG TPA: hypothetical protein VH761_12100 [Ilumatobacteraceae bacterium]|jgi:hypothetical protein